VLFLLNYLLKFTAQKKVAILSSRPTPNYKAIHPLIVLRIKKSDSRIELIFLLIFLALS